MVFKNTKTWCWNTHMCSWTCCTKRRQK